MLVQLAQTGSVAVENARLYEQLREADRRKDEVLAVLAHELRNPLAPIRNAMEILSRSAADEQKVKQLTEMMRRHVEQMVRLINDLLDVSRISRGKIELHREPVDLASVVSDAVESVRPFCESMDQELTVILPPHPTYLNADPSRVTQVVGNLLNNASKFTDRGGQIRLTLERVRGDRDAPEEARIRVHDTGIGMAPEHLRRIFEMFTQLDTSLERSRDGLGIGLTLVKNLVEMHGGRIDARSAGLGRGSEFVVHLPILSDPLPLVPAGRQIVDSATTAQRRILVVDDNVDSAVSLAMLLRLNGHEVYTAHDGLEAVEATAKFQPDVILLDIGLPKLNGYEAARRIREQQGSRKPILVALTGWGQEEDRRRSSEAGFDAHIVKPVDLDALSNLLVASVTG